MIYLAFNLIYQGNNMQRIESYRIPIVDPEDHSIGGKLKEFFDGYFYYGKSRYEVRWSGGRRDENRFQETHESHLAATILKIITIPLIVPVIIGAGFFFYNMNDRKSHNYEFIPMRTNLNLAPREVPQKVLQIPNAPGYSFAAFRNQAYRGIGPALSHFSKEQWAEMVVAYKDYINDNTRFMTEMLLLKRELLAWNPSELDRDLHEKINPQTFVESVVPEFKNTSIDALIALIPPNMQRDRSMNEVIINIVESRIEEILSDIMLPEDQTGLALNFYLNKLKTLTESASFGNLFKFLQGLQGPQLGEALRKLNSAYSADQNSPAKEVLHHFFNELAQYVAVENAETKKIQLKNAFPYFWQFRNITVPSLLPNYNPTLWQSLAGQIKFEYLPVVLNTIPADLASDGCRDIVEKAIYAVGPRSTHDFRNLEQISNLIAHECPQLAQYVPKKK